MKKINLLLAGIILFTASCKKGENDPFLSLHSRCARVVGDWNVSAGKGTDVNGGTTTNWTYATPNWSQTVGSTKSTNITISYSIKKDGTFTSVETTTANGYSNVSTIDGIWNLTGGAGDTKKRSQLLLQNTKKVTVTTMGSTSSTTTSSYTGNDGGTTIYDIDRLANKEMIIKYKDSSMDKDGKVMTSSEGEFTLVQ
jgi:hypothetical protein